VLLQKAKPAIWDGDRNPPGSNCRAKTPSAGIALKPSPTERDKKGTRASGKRRVSFWPTRDMSSNAVADT
jgi:hypothetical protein